MSTTFFSSVLRALRSDQDQAGDLRSFHSQASIRTALGQRKGDEDFTRAEMLLIFETRRQHTWLLATAKALYCVLDNRREPHARRLWRIPRDEIVRDGMLVLPVNEAELTERDSYVVINGKRPRKFTRDLFKTMTITDSVKSMLGSAFKL